MSGTSYEADLSAQDCAEYTVHQENVGKYRDTKSTYICAEDTLILEFRHSQNLPLSKIPVTEQLYRRLLWRYIFNAHVHGASGKSCMFDILEVTAKKEASPVCSFIVARY